MYCHACSSESFLHSFEQRIVVSKISIQKCHEIKSNSGHCLPQKSSKECLLKDTMATKSEVPFNTITLLMSF